MTFSLPQLLLGLALCNGALAGTVPRALLHNVPPTNELRQFLEESGVSADNLCAQYVLLANGQRRVEVSNQGCPKDGLVSSNEVDFSTGALKTTVSGNATLTEGRRTVGRVAWLRENGVSHMRLRHLCTGEYYASCEWVVANGQLVAIE